MQILKQSTAVDVLLGPFVDRTDGYTAEEGESPCVLLSKNGQALAAKNDATTPTHDDAGYYNCELDATDTGTVGTLVLVVEASANALPVRHEFQVVEEAVYEALFASSAPGYGTAQTGDTYALANGDHGFVSIQDDMDTVLTRLVGTIAAGTHNAQSGDSYAIVNGDHGLVSIQDDVDASKTKTDYLPSATAGASGGLFIVGANTGAVSITNSSGSALTLESTGSNGSGLACIGDGQGSGINASGGDSMLASGIYALGNSSLGGGIYARNSSGTGMHVVAAGSSAHGLNVSGYGTGSGIKASGGATDGDGLELAAGGSGKDLNAAEIDSIVT